MATIYKIEMELVSDWVSYSEEDMKTIRCGMIDILNEKQKKYRGNEVRLDFDKFKIERIR